MKIAVIHGGTSHESVASTENAREIQKALFMKGHQAELVNFDQSLRSSLKKYEVAFIAVQGKGHGDGTCQAICAHENIPYTGSEMTAAALINNKHFSKILCTYHGIPTSAHTHISYGEYSNTSLRSLSESIQKRMGFPAVAKASTQGGSYGIQYLGDSEKVESIQQVFTYDKEIIIEPFIEGVFVTASLLETSEGLHVLPLLSGSSLQHTTPENPLLLFNNPFQVFSCQLSNAAQQVIAKYSKKLFEIFGAKGYARIDFIVEKRSGIPYFLEINGVPGLRVESFFPQAAMMEGISMPDLCEQIVLNAIE